MTDIPFAKIIRFVLVVCLGLFSSSAAIHAADSVAQLQARFDQEDNAVRKAKLFEKLGEAKFAAIRKAEKNGDHNTVGLTFEKYRDNLRSVLENLKKQHPDAEKQSNGYRQAEVSVRKGIRELDESLLLAPQEYLPPLQLVRQDLVTLDNELLRMLFPRRPADIPAPSPTADPPKASEQQP